MMAETKLSYRLHKFSHLRTNRNSSWTTATQGQAPHKPILLLTVLDLFAPGRITANLTEITPELGELFSAYWTKVMPPELERCNERSFLIYD
jgi:putative restriction endonuclease